MMRPLLRHCCRLLTVALLTFASHTGTTAAASLLTNGDFETGNFTGWSVTAQGNGNWFVANGTHPPLNATDVIAGAANGMFLAVTDQTRPGAFSLVQAFTVPIDAGFVELSFSMFVDNYGPRAVTSTLDYTTGINQHARVDILADGASAFDTSASSVIANFYLGSDAGNTSNPYTHYRFNLTSLVTPGATYQIRFADVANQSVLHQGVDAVRIIAEIPEPGIPALFAAGLGVLLFPRRKKRGPSLT